MIRYVNSPFHSKSTRALSPRQRGRGVKLLTHIHLVPGVKKARRQAAASPYSFMVWCLVKYKRLVRAVTQAVIVASFSPRRNGFAPGSIHVEFVRDKVALGQYFLPELQFPPVNISPPWFSILVYHLGD
jgi:hypothetical protein